MPLLSANNPITSDGDYQLPKLDAGSRVIIMLEGAASAGTVSVQYEDGQGGYFDYLIDGSAVSETSDGSRISILTPALVVPPSATININANGLSGASVNVSYTYQAENMRRVGAPRLFPENDAFTSQYLWISGSEEMNPTDNDADGLVAGQAWEYDGNGDLQPTDLTITDDPFWEYDGSGDLQPIYA